MSSGFARFRDHAFPPKPIWEPERDMPDLTGKVVIVTGGNTGIGKETIKRLLQKNAKVYMASRSRTKAESAIADLKEETGKEALFLELDLADLDKVTKSAKEFKSKERELHILFNSGGVMVPPIGDLTADGYDLQFGTNCLGHAHFTLCLIPELLAGAASSSDGKARVVNVSSAVVYSNGPPLVDWDTLRDGPARKKKGTRALYGQSKYGVIAFSNELARQYGDQGILSNAVNPGNLKTDLQRHIPAVLRVVMNKLILHPAYLGCYTSLYAGTSPETVKDNGQWFIPWARKSVHDRYTSSPETEAKLWEWIQEQRKAHL